MGLKFVSDRVQEEWGSALLHPKLNMVLGDLARFAQWRFTIDLMVVCIYRTPDENDALYGNTGAHLTGPHVVWHAADIRTRDLEDGIPTLLSAYLNNNYVYDPNRKGLHVGVLESGTDPGSTAEHLHVQVCDDTQVVPVDPQVTA